MVYHKVPVNAIEYNCSGKGITELDLSGCFQLTKLYCSNNQLTVLDVSQNTQLTLLDCHNNNLTLLDVL